MPTPMDEWFMPRPKDHHEKLVETCLKQLAITRARLKREKAPSAKLSLTDFAAEIKAERIAMEGRA